MNGQQLFAILPLIVLASGALVVVIQIALRRDHAVVFSLTLAFTVIAFLTAFLVAGVVPTNATALLRVDTYTLFFVALICGITAAVAVFSFGYLRHRQETAEEYYLLLLLAALGASVLVASRHFASFLLGLEILSASLFAMIAYPLVRQKPLEAAIKYLILAGVSSALLLFGMALAYAVTGSMDFAATVTAYSALASPSEVILLVAAVALILTGIGFKLSFVPFHMWAPDVYEGAPAPVSAFLATVSKAAVFALLARYVSETDALRIGSLWSALAAIAIASMLVGNLLALLQTNVKRLLAYSSIAHIGYMLVALLAGGRLGFEAVAFYLLAYSVTNLGAFGVISLVSEQHCGQGDADRMNDYKGLFWRQPWLAGVLILMLLSLAGIPLTAGFIAKFYALAAGVAGGQWVLVVTLVVGSGIGLFYYLRFVVILFAQNDTEMATTSYGGSFLASRLTLAILTGLLILWGVYPTVFMVLAKNAAAMM